MTRPQLCENPLARFAVVLAFCLLAVVCPSARAADVPAAAPAWNAPAAARYLDERAAWWEAWPPAKRDHDTVCISCHTILPYVLARPRLSAILRENSGPSAESQALDYVRKRVANWAEMQPFYSDEKSGAGKSRESRATESVVNTLVACNESARLGQFDALARKAFDAAWALQAASGEDSGSWDWQVFRLEPWEADDSRYQGATFMALAVGLAPESYRREPGVRSHVELLSGYLRRQYARQTLLNRIVLLWASNRFSGLLSPSDRDALAKEILERQRSDGGWNLASFGDWKRSDHTPQNTDSDGYATAIAVLALKDEGGSRVQPAVEAGRRWLVNHQEADGSWRSVSLNKARDFESPAGKFMTDAATGYAVLALSASR